MRLGSRVIETPIGGILLAGTGRGLSCARVVGSDRDARAWARKRGLELVADGGSLDAAALAYQRYFAGRLFHFDIPFDLAWGTSFQRAVWDALRKIPWGATTTYGALARSLGLSAGSARAVGAANGANPIVIAIPCHRVVRETKGLSPSGDRPLKRTLGGFAYGLWRKEHLLRLEGAWPVHPVHL